MACNSQTREIERWRGVQRGVQLTLARGEAGAGGSDCASHGRGMGEAWAKFSDSGEAGGFPWWRYRVGGASARRSRNRCHGLGGVVPPAD